MISDNEVRRLFWNNYRMYSSRIGQSDTLPTQLFRGKSGYRWEGQHPGGCTRHKAVFESFNIIPEYCFSCFKVTTLPRNVTDLFKLMMLYHKLDLPDDNTRKCFVETRTQVSGTYKGIIYCRSIKEARQVQQTIKKLVAMNIGAGIPSKLGRGCSEYTTSYPEYPKVKNRKAVMPYPDTWRTTEAQAEKTLEINEEHSTEESHDSPGYTLNDTMTMLAWLRYAATIQDLSYMQISNQPLEPFQNIERPSGFNS